MTELNDTDLRRLLRRPESTQSRRGWPCPNDSRLAAYVEHRLPDKERRRVESHLAGCGTCLEQVTFLLRAPATTETEVPAELLARARNLVVAKHRTRFTPVTRWATLAATACLVLLIGRELGQVGTNLPRTRPTPNLSTATVVPLPDRARPAAQGVSPSSQPAPAPSATRSTAASSSTVRSAGALRNTTGTLSRVVVLSPREHATLSPSALDFRWQAVAGALYYEIQVLSDEGDVVWQDKLESTSVHVPEGHALQAGSRYFIKLRACLSGGGTVGSPPVSFSVSTR